MSSFVFPTTNKTHFRIFRIPKPLITIVFVNILYSRLYVLCLAILLLSAKVVFAQPEEQRFRSITIDDGLSQSTVVAICQDSLGFLWFGTKDGLNLYDGYSFTVFRNTRGDTTSIGGNNIMSLVVDTSGNIWAGCSNGKLSRYSHKDQRFTDVPLVGLSVSQSKVSAVSSLTLDSKGNVWAGTLAHGLYRVNPATLEAQHYVFSDTDTNILPENNVMALHATDDDYLWIGTFQAGLSRYNISTGEVDFYNESNNNLLSNHVNAIYQDINGTTWIGTDLGASVIEVGDSTFNSLRINPDGFPRAAVMAFAQTEKDYVWLSVYPQGIVKFNIETREWTRYAANDYNPYSISFNDVRVLFVDKTDNLWIGTNGGGINTLSPFQNFSLYKHMPDNPASLPNNSVRSILDDEKGNLYVGMYGGLMVYNKSNNTYKHYKSGPDLKYDLHNSSVYALKLDSSGKVWVGLEGGGLQLFDPVTQTFETYYHSEDDSTSLIDDNVLSLLVDSRNDLWVGTNAGLSLFNRGSGTFKHYLSNRRKFTGPFVRAILEDAPGYLWIGTDQGLFYLEVATGKSVSYAGFKEAIAEDESPEGVYCLHRDKHGLLWIGTQSSGLYKMEYENRGLDFSKAQFFCICDNEKQSQLTVYGILPDANNNLWISTDNGIMKYDGSENDWLRFTKTDGLQSNEFNAGAYFKASDGRLYFGGIGGISAFYPEKLRFNTTPPPVVLTDFKIFNKAYPLQQDIALLRQILLNYDENYLTFEFAALDFTAPEQNKYAYKLVGFDEDWIYPGSMRQATYSNLPPGQYVFKVRASNKDGYWNEDGVSVQIDIVPAIWSTIWFKGILVLIAILIFYLFFRAQLAGYKEKQNLLEEQLKSQSQKLQLEKLKTEYAVTQALIEGQNQEQKRISEDLHDGLGQTLTAASLNLMALETTFKEQKTEKTDEYLSNLQLLMSSAIQEVRNISHNLMPFLLAEEGLPAALDEMCHRAMKYGSLNINIQITGLNERIGESKEINIYRIAQEVISNAQKHSGAQNLMIKYHVDSDEITWYSEDDGIGFDPVYLNGGRSNGLGLKNIQVRVQLMKGTIKIITRPGKGVIIDIKIPR